MVTPTPKIAFWLERGDFAACEIAKTLGYDLVVIDMEHGAIGTDVLDRIVAHCRVGGLTCYVRVSAAARAPIQQALDFGADGVMVPQIQDVEHAAKVSAFAKYPPLGTRGVGFNRTMNYGGTGAGFFDDENRRTACHLMIETPGALRDVERIAGLGTVDGLFIGPADLSMTRGRGGYRFSDEDAGDFRTVAAAAHATGKQLGLPAPGTDIYAFAVAETADYVTISDDLSALNTGLAQALQIVRTGRK